MKPTNCEAKKTAKFKKEKIGRIENMQCEDMQYDAEGDHFICAGGRKPLLQ